MRAGHRLGRASSADDHARNSGETIGCRSFLGFARVPDDHARRAAAGQLRLADAINRMTARLENRTQHLGGFRGTVHNQNARRVTHDACLPCRAIAAENAVRSHDPSWLTASGAKVREVSHACQTCQNEFLKSPSHHSCPSWPLSIKPNNRVGQECPTDSPRLIHAAANFDGWAGHVDLAGLGPFEVQVATSQMRRHVAIGQAGEHTSDG